MESRRSRSSIATAAASSTPAGGPGSRSKTTASGVSGVAARAWRVCSSSAARFASHTSAAGSSTSHWLSSPISGTQSGWCGGQRFSKNRSPSTPFGHRTSVTGRPGEVGDHHRGDPGVVVDDLGLGEARPRGRGSCRGSRARAGARRPRRASRSSARRQGGVSRQPSVRTYWQPHRRGGSRAQHDLGRFDQLRARLGPGQADPGHPITRRVASTSSRPRAARASGYRRVSEQSGEEVPTDQIVKGYEIAKGRYVVVEKDELDAIAPKATRTIEIEDFVDLDEIDPDLLRVAVLRAARQERGEAVPPPARGDAGAAQGRDRAGGHAGQGAPRRDPADGRPAVRRDDALRRRGDPGRGGRRRARRPISPRRSWRWPASSSSRSPRTSTWRSTRTSTASS